MSPFMTPYVNFTIFYRQRIKIDIKELIVSGAFGRVYKARLDDSEELVAVKQTIYNPWFCQREAEISMGVPPMSYTMLIMEYMPMTLLYYLARGEAHLCVHTIVSDL